MGIEKVSYEEAMRRFKHVYVKEGLPYCNVRGATWYASEFSCGALVAASATKFRFKGGVTLPEHRCLGHGEAMLSYREQEAVNLGAQVLEVFSKAPAWFLRNDWVKSRVTAWGVWVLTKTLNKNP
jgi:hypothetical protein